jgi:hypothetical protein
MSAMRQTLVLIGLLALLTAPYSEYSHGHWLGQSQSDCPACQVKDNPGVLVVVVTDCVAPLTYHPGPLCTPPSPRAGDDRLCIAPKTSPPRQRG